MVFLTFRGPLVPKQLLTFVGQCCVCRRAMVNKLWLREIKRKWSHAKSEPPHARIFSEPGWQGHVTAWYLLYRWLIFVAWITIIICSIFEFGSYQPLGNNHKWPIYLTNWDLMLGAVQAFLGAFLVSRRWTSQRGVTFEPHNLTLGKVERVYWFLYVVTSTLAIGVTISYWCAVYDPKIHQIDPLNIMLHVCNTILMGLDLCVVSIPLSLKYFWWCLTIVTFYLIFSVIYYSAGGLDKHGNHYIYKVLDWKKPGRTLLICVGGLIFVIVVHCFLCFFARFRSRLCTKNTNFGRSKPPILDDEPALAIRQIEIIV